MNKKFKIIVLLFLFMWSPKADAQTNEHSLFTDVLQKYVQEGQVNYPGICNEELFNQYIAQLSNTKPRLITSKAKSLAFWINAYNAFTLDLICDNYPIKSINELHTGGLIFGIISKKTAWDKKFIQIDDETYSLDDIEHKIIRPIYNEPRIHFAIVCAAKGCPPLRSEAYEGIILDQQLDDQASQFLAQPVKNSFDAQKRVAYLSPIFKWFKKDFGKNPQEIISFVAQFLNENIQEDINSAPEKWKIRYTKYDWDLNE